MTHADNPQIYLNNHFLPYNEAALSIDDRGTLFGEGVYEVVDYYDHTPFALDPHVQRLRRSLEGIRIPAHDIPDRLVHASERLIQQNGFPNARVYWQVTRGSGPRAHLWPDDLVPTVMAIANPIPPFDPDAPISAVRAITHEDHRWSQCCYKTLMLLPNTLAKDQARRAGCHEAILHRDGTVTEGSSTNILIVRDEQIHTHPADQWILPGITRAIVLDQARKIGLTVHETPFSVDDLYHADEVMLTSTTQRVTAITHVDDRAIHAGEPGPITTRLYQGLVARIRHDCTPSTASK